MGSGHHRSLLPALLLLLPAAWGDCGPLPNMSHAGPPEDLKHRERFPVGFKVTYRCLAGYTKLPLLSDTIQCLANTEWSNLREFCGRSCSSPTRVHFARLSDEDAILNFYAVNTTVTYVCRPGYENTTDQLPTSTCLDNVTWSAVPELCRRKSCGMPANPEHGKVIANNHLFGARADVVCDHGYVLKGALTFIFCYLVGDRVAWSQLPACQALTCPPPPAIPSGKHDGNSTEEFTYSSRVTYSCDPGLQLVGNETLRCTTENGADGIWSGPPPKCRAVISTAAATNQTTPLKEEKVAGSPYWIAAACVSICLAIGIPSGVVLGRKLSRKDNYNMQLQKHEMGGRGSLMHPEITDNKKQPVPWHSYFCHTTSCHVCPTCEERLHAALAPGTEPAPHGCATCKDWQHAQLSALHTYLVPSIDSVESWSPGGTSSPANAAEVPRADGSGRAVPEQSKAEQPMNQKSDRHVCPICESWLCAHLGWCGGRPAAPGEQGAGPCRQDEGPQGPVCPPCAYQLDLSFVHGDTAACPVCPLAREGTLAHLVPRRSPGCHVCPVCAVPAHAHLCQPRHQARDGRDLRGGAPKTPFGPPWLRTEVPQTKSQGAAAHGS